MTLEPGTYSIDLPAKHDQKFTDWRTANGANVKITLVNMSNDRKITQYAFKVTAPVEWLEGVAKPKKGAPDDVNPTSDVSYPAEKDPLDILQESATQAAKTASTIVYAIGAIGGLYVLYQLLQSRGKD